MKINIHTARKIYFVIFISVLISLSILFIVLRKSNHQDIGTRFYNVASVVDGDTIKVNISGSIETVRLIGIDTPEIVDPRSIVQCFGKEASDKAKELMSGEVVRLEADSSQGDRDIYNRILRYVYLEDGTFINKFMIEQGYALEYTKDIPYKYQTEFKTAEKNARERGIGLWASNTCAGDTTQHAK